MVHNDTAASHILSITFACIHCGPQLSWRGWMPEGFNCAYFLWYLFLIISGWLSVYIYKHMHEWVNAYSVLGELLRWLMQAMDNISTIYKENWGILATEWSLRLEDSADNNQVMAMRIGFEEVNSQRFVVRDCQERKWKGLCLYSGSTFHLRLESRAFDNRPFHMNGYMEGHLTW